MIKRVLYLIIGTAFLPTAGAAQEVAFDAAIGKYRVSYHSGHLGRQVVLLVEPPNQIDPLLRLTEVGEIDGKFAYRYVIQNRSGQKSRQPVVEFDFDCPPRQLVNVIPPADWELAIGRSGERFACIVIEETADRRASIAPGETLRGLEVETSMLPTVGVAHFWGDAESVEWPVGESAEVRDLEVIQAVNQLEGITGGWVERTVITPTRDPNALGASDILHGLAEDLARICEEREWITERLCRSYQADLRELIAAILENRSEEARQIAAELLSDLAEDRQGPELDLDAYWLLRRNLEVAVIRIGEGREPEDASVQSSSSNATNPEPAPAAEVAPTAAVGFWSRLWSAIRNLGAA